MNMSHLSTIQTKRPLYFKTSTRVPLGVSSIKSGIRPTGGSYEKAGKQIFKNMMLGGKNSVSSVKTVNSMQSNKKRLPSPIFLMNDTRHTPPMPTSLVDPPPVNTTTHQSDNPLPPIDHDRFIEPYTSISAAFTAIPVCIIIFIIVVGNAMVIAAVLRDPRLKKQVQNWLIVSLAVADALVGLLIMPLTLTYELLDEWILGDILCELWLALDVLFVTASILNLCAISVDRYFSLTNPMQYPQKRTPKRMALMILVVWLSAFAISFPPLVGWRPEKREASACFLSDQLGYVLYSALGSFFIPTIVLLFVYAKIYFITKRRSKKKQPSNPLLTREVVVLKPRPPIPSKTERSDSNSSEHIVHEPDPVPPPPSTQLLTPHGGNLVNSPRPSIGQHEILFAENDYALLVAKIRNLAMNPRQSIISDNITSDSGVSIPPETLPSEKAFSIVNAIASEAVAQSRARQEVIDLKKQLLQRQKLVRRRERQATLVLGLVLGAFIGSWLPFFSSYVLSALGLRTPDLLFDVIFWLGYCNSGLNAFIYNFFNPDFRRAFRRILKEPIEKFNIQMMLISADRRRSSTASALIGNGRKSSRSELVPRNSQRRGVVFSPHHPYLQMQDHRRA